MDIINVRPLRLLLFYDFQISRIKKKIRHVQGQKHSIKCAYRERGSKLMVVWTHMDYIFPTENENVLLSQCWTHFILPSKFRIFIHNVADCPILDKYEIWSESVCIPLIFGKGSSVVSRVSNLFQIQQLHPRRKSCIGVTKYGSDAKPIKG